MPKERVALLIIGVVALVMVAAGASAYVTREKMTPPEPVKTAQSTHSVKHQVNYQQPAQQAQPVQQASRCDDGNIVGTGIGAVGGGLIGHQLGGGKGKDLATIGGAIAGGYAGHQLIPTRNTLCR